MIDFNILEDHSIIFIVYVIYLVQNIGVHFHLYLELCFGHCFYFIIQQCYNSSPVRNAGSYYKFQNCSLSLFHKMLFLMFLIRTVLDEIC